MYIYLFKDKIKGNTFFVGSEEEAADTLGRFSLYTKEKEFEYVGAVEKSEYDKLLKQVKKKVTDAIKEISETVSNERGTATIIKNEQRMSEIRKNEKNAEQKIYDILAKQAKKVPLKASPGIFMDDRARQAMQGTTLNV